MCLCLVTIIISKLLDGKSNSSLTKFEFVYSLVSKDRVDSGDINIHPELVSNHVMEKWSRAGILDLVRYKVFFFFTLNDIK